MNYFDVTLKIVVVITQCQCTETTESTSVIRATIYENEEHRRLVV